MHSKDYIGQVWEKIELQIIKLRIKTGNVTNIEEILLMENSKAYKYLIEQINATGLKKLDGYYPKIMEEIYA